MGFQLFVQMGIISDLEEILAFRPHYRRLQHLVIHITQPQLNLNEVGPSWCGHHCSSEGSTSRRLCSHSSHPFQITTSCQ